MARTKGIQIKYKLADDSTGILKLKELNQEKNMKLREQIVKLTILPASNDSVNLGKSLGNFPNLTHIYLPSNIVYDTTKGGVSSTNSGILLSKFDKCPKLKNIFVTGNENTENSDDLVHIIPSKKVSFSIAQRESGVADNAITKVDNFVNDDATMVQDGDKAMYLIHVNKKEPESGPKPKVVKPAVATDGDVTINIHNTNQLIANVIKLVKIKGTNISAEEQQLLLSALEESKKLADREVFSQYFNDKYETLLNYINSLSSMDNIAFGKMRKKVTEISEEITNLDFESKFRDLSEKMTSATSEQNQLNIARKMVELIISNKQFGDNSDKLDTIAQTVSEIQTKLKECKISGIDAEKLVTDKARLTDEDIKRISTSISKQINPSAVEGAVAQAIVDFNNVQRRIEDKLDLSDIALRTYLGKTTGVIMKQLKTNRSDKNLSAQDLADIQQGVKELLSNNVDLALGIETLLDNFGEYNELFYKASNIETGTLGLIQRVDEINDKIGTIFDNENFFQDLFVVGKGKVIDIVKKQIEAIANTETKTLVNNADIRFKIADLLHTSLATREYRHLKDKETSSAVDNILGAIQTALNAVEQSERTSEKVSAIVDESMSKDNLDKVLESVDRQERVLNAIINLFGGGLNRDEISTIIKPFIQNEDFKNLLTEIGQKSIEEVLQNKDNLKLFETLVPNIESIKDIDEKQNTIVALLREIKESMSTASTKGTRRTRKKHKSSDSLEDESEDESEDEMEDESEELRAYRLRKRERAKAIWKDKSAIDRRERIGENRDEINKKFRANIKKIKSSDKDKQIKFLDLLGEPKRTPLRRFRKFAGRHPFLASLAIGAGVIGATALSVASIGGIGAISFGGYLGETMATGTGIAGAIVGTGLLGEIGVRVFNKQKTERSYTRLQRKVNSIENKFAKADRSRGTLDSIDKTRRNKRKALANTPILKHIKPVKSCVNQYYKVKKKVFRWLTNHRETKVETSMENITLEKQLLNRLEGNRSMAYDGKISKLNKLNKEIDEFGGVIDEDGVRQSLVEDRELLLANNPKLEKFAKFDGEDFDQIGYATGTNDTNKVYYKYVERLESETYQYQADVDRYNQNISALTNALNQEMSRHESERNMYEVIDLQSKIKKNQSELNSITEKLITTEKELEKYQNLLLGKADIAEPDFELEHFDEPKGEEDPADKAEDHESADSDDFSL